MTTMDWRPLLERAQAEPPADLRAWVWSLAPCGKRVLVAVASAVMSPAMEGWQLALEQDPGFSAHVGDNVVLGRARDAVLAWLDAPSDEAIARIHAITPALTVFLDHLRFVASELSGDGNLHGKAEGLAHCIQLAVSAATWTDDEARRNPDAAEQASRIAAGPAYEAAEAVGRYAAHCPEHRASIIGWIAAQLTR